MTGDAIWTPPVPRTILVAEDEAIVAQDLCGRLAGMNFTVVAVAKTADDAVRHATTLHPEIALLDIMLRGHRDGIEAAREIRQ
ncbi:partial putative transcriptional regulatory protein pdtaR, partial [Anaerolineae bacterium]